MATYYVDFKNGTDWGHTSSGATWETAFKTLSGLTSVMTITSGDIARVSKSEDSINTGINAKWSSTVGGGNSHAGATNNIGAGVEASKNISSSTNATPVVVTVTDHGYIDGDVIQILGHTTNLSANGCWIITGVTTSTFELIDSVGVGVGASGTARRVNPRVILLDEPLTKNIHTCNYLSSTINNWSVGYQVTSANLSTTIWKEGYSSVYIITNSSTVTGRTLAYSALKDEIDLSSYSGVSFKIRCNFAQNFNNGDLVVKLYSDTGCTLEVESLNVKAFTSSTNNWQSCIIHKGSALSSTVNGIAIYANAAFASKQFWFDNFIAIKGENDNACINHKTMLSKNSLSKINSGNTEGWYPIKSINNRVVVIDNHMESYANNGMGYYGVTENVILYKRNPIELIVKTDYNHGLKLKSLTAGLICEFGYNTGTTVIDGECLFDFNGGEYYYINGDRVNPTVGHLLIIRCLGFYWWSSSETDELSIIGCSNMSVPGNPYYGIVKNIWNVLNNNFTFRLYGYYGFFIDKIWNVMNSPLLGIATYYQTYSTNYIREIGMVCNNLGGGIQISNISKPITIGLIANNGSGSINSNAVAGLTNIGNLQTVYISSGITNNDRAVSLTEGGVFNGMGTAVMSGNYKVIEARGTSTYGRNIFKNFNYIQNIDGDTYNDSRPNSNFVINETQYISVGSGTASNKIQRETSDVYSGSTSWKISIERAPEVGGYIDGKTIAELSYPVIFNLGKVYVQSGLTTTVSAYIKKSHSVNIGAKLHISKEQLSGITTDLETYATGTTWEKITLPSFIPLQSGVIQIDIYVWYVNSTTNYVLVDFVEINQS